jgi:predicted 3-demethylubiquinone-9 3-methyltransferase (glyoxalase superfamily)
MQKISPMLWFDHEAEEAAKFYVSIFKNSRITATVHHGEAGPGPQGGVLTVAFEIEGQAFTALNGGPHFKLNEAVSFVVDCADQAEVDYFWDRLLEGGGKPEQCGWLRDRFGLTWQIVPRIIPEVMSGPDRAKADRLLQAVFQMVKPDVAAMMRAVAD